VFRTLIKQGGVNGITGNARRNDNTAVILRESRAAPDIVNPTVPCYTVLMGVWDVRVSERQIVLPDRVVDCNAPSTCQAAGFISALTVDTQCGQGRAGAPNVPQVGLDITLVDNSGVQFRGPLQRQLRTNCTLGDYVFVGPTCCDAGNMLINFGVLSTAFTVRVENQKFGIGQCGNRTGGWPQTPQHPTVSVPVDCTSPSCATLKGQIFSRLLIQSLRGLPDSVPGPQYAALKFGNNQQNVIRIVTNAFLVAPDLNSWCVLADPRPWYAINWENWASDGPNLPFADCSNRDNNAIDVCQVAAGGTIIVPTEDK